MQPNDGALELLSYRQYLLAQAGYMRRHRHEFNLMRGALYGEGGYEETFFGTPKDPSLSKKQYERLKRENRDWIENG